MIPTTIAVHSQAGSTRKDTLRTWQSKILATTVKKMSVRVVGSWYSIQVTISAISSLTCLLQQSARNALAAFACFSLPVDATGEPPGRSEASRTNLPECQQPPA